MIKLKNIPNTLSVIRLLLVPIFVYLFLSDFVTSALIVFILAGATDVLDGYIARKFNCTSTLGKILDPLADKMLTTAAFLVLAHHGRASVIAVMLILTREFIVSGIRLVAAGGGKVIAASWWGKIKTIFQMVAIIVAILLFLPIFPENVSVMITDTLVWLSAVITVVSGYDYVAKNFDLIKEAK